MIVDLLRNDLGRIACPGSVSVTDLATAERYRTVWQLTSTVTARVPGRVGLLEAFMALFPSGSVTGAPKRAAMDVISQLEPSSRGVYCGAVGFVRPGGSARFAVAIRTATVELATGLGEYGTGGAITWPSVAIEEWDEAAAKCAVLDRIVAPTGLFETFGYVPDVGDPGWALHLDRLGASADYFAIPFDRQRADRRIREALATARRPRRVRVDLLADGVIQIQLSDPPLLSSDPVRLVVSDERVDSSEIFLYHKTIERTRYEKLRAANPGFDDVVMVNERGEITETTIANLVVKLGEEWWTPTLDSGLLPGVERQRLLEGGRIRERVMTVEDLLSARQVAVINSLRGWRRAVVGSRRIDT